jgi:DNA-binding PadR family transcriptional regulator
MSSRPPPSVITPRDLARLRVLAEISAAGPLEFSRLIRKFARGPAFDSDTPLAPLLRTLEEDGLVRATSGHPRRYCLALLGRRELHALIQSTGIELARRLS